MPNFDGNNNPWVNQMRGTGYSPNPDMYRPSNPYNTFNNFSHPSIPGRQVGDVNEITPQEVPMDGTVSLFPQNDYSCIYAKAWTKEGNIQTVRYIPEQPQGEAAQGKSPLEERLDRIEQKLVALDKKLNRPRNFQKRNNPHPKKEMNENE